MLFGTQMSLYRGASTVGYIFLLKDSYIFLLYILVRTAQTCSVAFSSLVKSFISILSCVAAGKATSSGFGHLHDRDLWKCTCSLCGYVRNPTVGREKDFSFILKLLPNSCNLCIFF